MIPIRQSRWLLALVAATVSACAPRWRPPDRPCPAHLRPVYTADSILTICVDTSFVTHDLNVWQRPRPPLAARDVIIINTRVSPTEEVIGGWPWKLGSSPRCQADCTTADSVIARQDTVAGYPAYTEVGLVSGGLAGWRREPAFVSSWTVSASERGTAQAWSSSRATLDTLLMTLHSARPGPRATAQPPNPRQQRTGAAP